jgi:hypothetical protein
MSKVSEDIEGALPPPSHYRPPQAFSEVAALSYTVANPSQLQREDVSPGFFSSLTEACQVVDALGPAARKVRKLGRKRGVIDPHLDALGEPAHARQCTHMSTFGTWPPHSLPLPPSLLYFGPGCRCTSTTSATGSSPRT